MAEQITEKGDNSDTFSLINKTKGKLPRLPFVEIKNTTLGKDYNLSLVFIGETKSKNLNRIYREKNKVANVLSFPLSKKEGEIFICSKKAKKEATLFKNTYYQFVGFLFIHGLLHLKGEQHGATMEKQERLLLKRFTS